MKWPPQQVLVKLQNLIVNIGVPGGIAFKAASWFR